MLCDMHHVKTPSRKVALLVLTILLIGGTAARGQRPQGGGTLIIDFTAVTADGKPVADLKPEDLTVKVAGKTRTVSSLTPKKIEPPAAAAATPAATAAAPGAGDVSAPFFTNDAKAAGPTGGGGNSGRFFLIVVDTDSLQAGTEAQLKTALGNLLNGLTPADRVAFSIAPRDTAQVGFGMGLQKVKDAVAALRGSRPASVSTAESLCRTSDTLNLVKALIDPLQANDVPTSVVFVAGSLSSAGSASSTSGGTCAVTQDQYQTLAGVAAAAHANFYVIQGDASSMGRNEGLETLASVTGGSQVLRVVNEGFAPRVLTDSSNYYVATLAPDPSDRPGQSQRLEVKSVKEGVTIRARSEAAIGRNAAPAAAPAKPGTTSPGDMIKTTTAYTDLQLRATAYYQRGNADKMTVMVFAEPADPANKIKEMTIGFFDQAGAGGKINPPKLDSSPITTILPALGVGQYRIRVAATDVNGKSGAVDIPLNTNLIPAGPAKLGSLMVGAPNGAGAMVPRVPVFTTEEKAMVMFELYAALGPETKAKLGFELASSDTGDKLNGEKVREIQPSGVNPTNEPDKFAVFGEISLKDLPPGDYVIRGLFQVEGQPAGRTIRTIRKVAK